MTKKEKVIDGLTHCGLKATCTDSCYYDDEDDGREVVQCIKRLCRDALDLIQDTMVSAEEISHAIANVDIPEGVSEAQFYSVLDRIFGALTNLYGTARGTDGDES